MNKLKIKLLRANDWLFNQCGYCRGYRLPRVQEEAMNNNSILSVVFQEDE